MAIKSLLWTLLLAGNAAAQAAAACSGQEFRSTTLDGSIVSLCPDSTYNGATYKTMLGVASGRACFDLCFADTSCTVAEYVENVQWCLFKKAPTSPKLTAGTYYDVFQVVSRAVAGRTLSVCPQTASEYKASNGATYAFCAGSDYRGVTLQRLSNVWTNQQCADICSDTAGCTQAVWEYDLSVCHVKGPSSGLTWTQDSKFSTIIQISGPK